MIDITEDLGFPQVLEQNDYLPFGARMYDPFTARWTAVDPMAKGLLSHSPFLYCSGDPIALNDPDGLFPETVWDVVNIVMDAKSLASNIKKGNTKGAVVDVAGLVVDAIAAIIPIVPAGAGTAIKAARGVDKVADIAKTSDKAVDAAKSIEKAVDAGKEGSKLVISEVNKVDRSLLNAPNKPGNAPTFKSDGTKVEIHHIGQDPQGPYKEMHWSDHRVKGHYKENHPKTNTSNIDRKSFNAQKKEYWKKEYWKNEYKTNN